MDLDACLPDDLRGATITPIAAGLSGAGVYRVGERHVLKIAAADDARWSDAVAIEASAADAGIAPRIVHVDRARRAVVSEAIVDRGFPRLLGERRADAIALLGRTLARVHALPIAGASQDRRALLGTLQVGAAPDWARDAIAWARSEPPPPAGEPVLSHNDANPSNLIFDGQRMCLLDWSTAGPNDREYDLATVALFLRLDDPTELLAAYGAPCDLARLAYHRRFIAVLCGAMFLHLAHQRGFTGDAPFLSLAEVHARMRARELDLSRAEGLWQFGVALLSEARGG